MQPATPRLEGARTCKMSQRQTVPFSNGCPSPAVRFRRLPGEPSYLPKTTITAIKLRASRSTRRCTWLTAHSPWCKPWYTVTILVVDFRAEPSLVQHVNYIVFQVLWHGCVICGGWRVTVTEPPVCIKTLIFLELRLPNFMHVINHIRDIFDLFMNWTGKAVVLTPLTFFFCAFEPLTRL
jgi:hypothetical protein